MSCLAVNYIVQVTSPSMQLIKLLPTIYCRGNRLLLTENFPWISLLHLSFSPRASKRLLSLLLFSSGMWCLNNKTNSSAIPSSVLGHPHQSSKFYIYLIKTFPPTFIKIFEKKNLENTFQSLIEFFQFKKFEQKFIKLKY